MPLPNETSFTLTSFLLKKCAATATLRPAQRLHGLLLTSLPASEAATPFVYNNIISMYVKCGSLVDSFKVFDTMPQRNVVSYNTVISAYSRNPAYALSSFDVLSQMRYEGLWPNSGTFIGLLQAASCLGYFVLGLEIHGLIFKSGVLNDACVLTSLLGVYSNYGNLESAVNIFECSVVRDSTTWNCIISGCLKNGRIEEGLVLYRKMTGEGFVPTEFTYSLVFKACGMLGYYKFGRHIHGCVILSNVLVDLPLQNALIDMYSSCGDSHSAFNVFCGINNPDIVSFNSMILAYSNDSDGKKAMVLFTRMQEMHNVKPDEYTFAAVISATDEFPAYSYGQPLHALSVKFGCGRNVYVASPLISMYFVNNMIEYAEQVFCSIDGKDLVLWTEMIAGYARAGDDENALKFFYDMLIEGHKVDSFSLSSALKACADLASLNLGQMIHCLCAKAGWVTEMSVCATLVDMYAKNGSLEAAESIFSEVTSPDLKCWNAMVGAYSHHGKAEEALKLYQEILGHDLKPDEVSFISLLSVCSHRGLIEIGKHLWEYMKANRLALGLKHYSCMVSLLSRAGLLKEAVEIIYEAPFSENKGELWRTILSSAVAKQNLRVGVHAAEKILGYDAEDSATHILLSNLYAAMGMWDCVTNIRKRIRGLMMEKDPGLSWIEVGKGFEVFSSGDQSHPKIDDVQAQLRLLQHNIMIITSDVDGMGA